MPRDFHPQLKLYADDASVLSAESMDAGSLRIGIFNGRRKAGAGLVLTEQHAQDLRDFLLFEYPLPPPAPRQGMD